MAWLQAYIAWAQAMDPDAKVRIWGACLMLVLIYVIVDNWDVIWQDPGPDDKDDPWGLR